MMFLFAGHSDKPLKSLISMAHKGNHTCLHRFSFIYVMDDLWEDAYTCPVNVMNCTTRSAIYVMELRVMGWVPIKGGDDKMRSFSMSCDSPIIKGHTSRSFIFGFCRSEHGLTDFQIEFLWSVYSKYCSFITYEIMNVKWTNIVFVLRYGDETLHLWKPLLNTNDQRGSSQCLTQRNTIFVHFTFMFS